MLSRIIPKNKNKLPILRIDDRLVHSQVVIGWGSRMDLQAIILASDRSAGDEILHELYASLIPPEIEGAVLKIDDLSAYLQKSHFNGDVIIIVENAHDALRILENGVKVSQVVIGGMRTQKNCRRLLAYVYLDDNKIDILKKILFKSVPVICQDLPSSPPYKITDKILDSLK